MGSLKTLLLIVVGFLSFNNLSFQRQQESDDCSFSESNGVVDEKKGSIYVAPKSAFDDEYVVEANVEYNAGSAFNMSDYFRNLYDYSPLNRAGGSCGFVSLINLLTFYDTFFNDDVIPEQYDAHGAGFETLGEPTPVPLEFSSTLTTKRTIREITRITGGSLMGSLTAVFVTTREPMTFSRNWRANTTNGV